MVDGVFVELSQRGLIKDQMNRNPRTFFVFFCLFFSILLLAGCKSKVRVSMHTPWMEKWLTNPTCDPPCMEGITPGISTAKEANWKEFLLTDINRPSSPYYDEKAIVPEIGCQGISYYSDESTGIVKSTSVDVYCENDNTTVKEIISVYGNPDYEGVERLEFGCLRHYVWLDKGLAIVGYKEGGFFSLFEPVDPEILVSRIVLFDPNSGPESALSTVNIVPFTSIENDPCEN